MLAEILVYFISLSVIALLIFWRFWFLRDPERKIPEGRNIVSPADGEILKIINVKDSELNMQKGHLGRIHSATKEIGRQTKVISIFMSPFDVHYNRAPVSGKIISVKHTKGKFFSAFNFEKSLENEKNEIVIKNRGLGKIKVIQVAGFLARRIVCFAKKNNNVAKGGKIGLINLGSQCVLIMPQRARIKVKEGERVLAGSTILGVY